MTSVQAQTARLLLDRVSPEEQVALVRDLARSLSLQSGKSDLSFTATLLQLKPDAEASKTVFEHLDHLIEQGELDQVLAVCTEHEDINSAIIGQTCTLISEAADALRNAPRDYFVVASLNAKPKSRQGPQQGDQHHVSVIKRTINCLRLVNRVSLHGSDGDRIQVLFQSCLVLLGAESRDLRVQSQEALSFLLSTQKIHASTDQQHIWARVQDLIRFPDKTYKAVGYSLWLRWISTAAAVESSIINPTYWGLIMSGLREGDNERRKSCLQILRASVDAASQNADTLKSITVPSGAQECAAPAIIQKHYARYCTVFETVVLSRYLNQVQECEADLDFLCSDKSVVQPVWVYTLLSCGLDQRMQESNRKLVGLWALRANPRVDGKTEYLKFLQESFLPWATLGNLFTSTLRRQDGVVVCEHGDKLSTFVEGLLVNNPELFNSAVDATLASISGRYGNRFSQAKVYLINGIAKAVNRDPALTLSDVHLEKIHEIATWANLTEVARDYTFAQVWSLSHDRVQKLPSSTKFVSEAVANWKSLVEKAGELPPKPSAERDGSIASMALPPSNREKNEQKTLQRCRAFLSRLEDISAPITVDAVEEELDDIWNDLEYLEMPKGLLAIMGKVFLHHSLIRLAIQSKNQGLATTIATKTKRLLQLAQPRSYMLFPLIAFIRDVVTAIPESATALQLSDLIVHIAERPPAATIDIQLEEVLVPLISDISPSLSPFRREFYFGAPESRGFATLLDLVSRVGTIHAGLPRQIFDEIFQPWLTQKVPPNVVSQWKTILELQVMLLCCEQFIPAATSTDARRILTDMQYVLSLEPLPRYRYLLEWIVARIYIHHPELRDVIFKELRAKDHHANPKFLASLMKIGVRVAKAKGADEQFALQLATLFVPLAASSKVVIRHEAQWQVPILLDHVRQMQIDAITSNTAFEALDEFIRSLEVYGDPPLERQIGVFDPINDHNLAHLVEGHWHDLDDTEQRMCSRADFLALYEEDDPSRILPPSCIPLGDPVPARPVHSVQNSEASTSIDHERRLLQNMDQISRSFNAGPVSATALQTKGAAYLESTRKRHNNLFVVASLVDNPYNLGGLSRVSEIFGAGGLYLENPRVTSNKDFTSTAVSSHHHLSINALAPAEIQKFLARKRREEGYSVVGIEQTDRSVMLGSTECVLAEKCLLVMGSEREGIPALILSECDMLVEIPQVGITRSLNVQTAAGIVLCEYARQHNSKLK
ncbi:hypothetical protein CERZMDRAFT_33451 [Cercospora zeae-maydis SCOH1-5]|uniref:tRNA/rRNA methyltransferase SpoU type domain-containing protein n=1 Tax=Cercospora zeae-maydis SCOH1-5 TaxID=717836 RepID=A0A6A6FTC3_9PEZI|nr:hypothetical protein CERZMDRAFT_33451 [Cercospora zeae-maydis SCOH1-5]